MIRDPLLEPRFAPYFNCDSDHALEHLVLEVLDWGDTPENRRFPLPGAVLIGWLGQPISQSPAVQEVIQLINARLIALNPLEQWLKLDPSVKYRVEFRAGAPNSRAALGQPTGTQPLKVPKVPGWLSFVHELMKELVDAHLNGSILHGNIL